MLSIIIFCSITDSIRMPIASSMHARVTSVQSGRLAQYRAVRHAVISKSTKQI
jgi:hypothetical protein